MQMLTPISPRLMMASTVIATAAVSSAVSVPALADPVVDQINQGVELYQNQDYGAAITELEFAIEDIRKRMSQGLAATFPDAPAGWSAGAAETSSESGAVALFGGAMGTILERQYTQEAGNSSMTATLTMDNPMIQGMATLFNNPALLAAQPNVERLRIGRETGMLKWEQDRSRAEATLMLDGRIMMQVVGENLESAEIVADLLKAWDIQAVREQSAR
ncbi:MAG: hypothetical protein VBE63_06670 [Lamprobacter sp.]|uniref:hypothetical protein n=1 Tax=Lamprobacter sp. TaxID=3100796 RepID=UPI002B26456D|nr:hypothetical protein [Lamprobacter sp.]MEA3639611.1 hypothetical protein [Lamprobacter sp.]